MKATTTRYIVLLVVVVTGWLVSSRLAAKRPADRAVPREDDAGGHLNSIPAPQSLLEPLTLAPYRACRGNASMFVATSPGGLQLLIWVSPRHCNRGTKPLPLLVYIHGAGEVGDDPSMLLDSEGGRGSVPSVLCRHPSQAEPSSAANDDDAAEAETSRHPLLSGATDALVVMPHSRYGWSSSDDELRDVKAMLDRLISGGVESKQVGLCPAGSPASIRVNPKQVVVTGVSQGGYGTLRFTTLFPGFVTVAAPLCPFGGEGFSRAVGSCESTRVFLAHGENDAVIPSSESRNIAGQCSQCKPVTIHVEAAASLSRAVTLAQPPVDVKVCKFLFAEFAKASDPLDGNPLANGHAVWRDVYATTSPFWSFAFESHDQ